MEEKKCPECGEIAMRKIQQDCTLQDGLFIPNLPHHYCNSCKSKFFDDASMAIIESYRNK